jgi:NAD(P)-dependent dehydrogenase (short-subunit alcohol dehydrogenase family)
MDGREQSVVITGASTGIGRACALTLAARGMRVFAGVRRTPDADALRSEGQRNVTPVFIDVTHPEAINSVAQQVEEETGGVGLDGLVNNAGIAVGGPLEFVPLSQLRRQFEINAVGQIAVTQSFLPLLRRAQGRVVLMGSVSGVCSLPLLGPYCASKFALEALADALRLELRPWGMHVSIIEPGATKTAIWDKSIVESRATLAGLPAEAELLYGEVLARFERMSHKTHERAIPPVRVVEAVTHALTARRPKVRYLIGEMARVQLALELLPVQLRDFILSRLLFGQPYPALSTPAPKPELSHSPKPSNTETHGKCNAEGVP